MAPKQEGVLAYVSDSTIEQELTQMLLAYTVILRMFGAGGAPMNELNKTCEDQLWEMFQVDSAYTAEYGVKLLESYHLVETKGNQVHALPLRKALQTLASDWDKMFDFSNIVSYRGSPALPATPFPSMNDMHEGGPSGGGNLGRGLVQVPSLAKELAALQEKMEKMKTENSGTVERYKNQQTLLCNKIKELEVAMEGLL
jgi:hypothetical protein